MDLDAAMRRERVDVIRTDGAVLSKLERVKLKALLLFDSPHENELTLWLDCV